MKFKKNAEGKLVQVNEASRTSIEDEIGNFWAVFGDITDKTKSNDLVGVVDIPAIISGMFNKTKVYLVTKDKKKAQKKAEELLSNFKK